MLTVGNQVVSQPAAMEKALWDSREPSWAHAPDSSPAAEQVLGQYFYDGRAPAWPERPDPELSRLADLVLRQKGSAPGLDNVPYEIWHQHPTLAACLLGQGLLARSASGLRE